MQTRAHRQQDPTLLTYGDDRLSPLCKALGLSNRAAEVSAMFRRLLGDLGATPLKANSHWPSHVGDDGTPYEFSVAFGRSPELRIMVEPLGAAPSLVSNGAASLATLRALARDYPIDLTRLLAVEDLFLPSSPKGAFAIWVAVSFGASGGPEFKIYLCPEAKGVEAAPALVEEAMVRLGLPRAWPSIGKVLARRGPQLDQLKYVSLDLSPAATARVKIYARHEHCTRDDLEASARLSPYYRAGEITRYLDALAPGEQLFAKRAPFTCYAFVSDDVRPEAVTTHFPINAYADNDRTVQKRVAKCLDQLELGSDAYIRAIDAYANRSLESAVGLHSYVSVKRDGSGARLTVYLPVEAYGVKPDASNDTVERASGTTAIVTRYEHDERITNHPFLLRLHREPVDLHHLHRLLANFQISISRYFARRLASIIARVDDDRIRCILAEQLNDEMGNGKFERAHTNLFSNMMAQLEPWKPREPKDSDMTPGLELNSRLAEIYGAEDINFALGAIVAGEVFGKQIDQFLGDEFRRQQSIDTASLQWLVLHEQLEVDHADSSAVLERLLPGEAADAARAGAEALARAGWRFLDDLYALCYGGLIDA